MRRSVQSKIKAGFAAALVVLVVISVASYSSIRELISTVQRVVRTHAVIESLESTLADIKAVESDTRGFVITSDDRFLRSYGRARGEVPRSVKRLRSLTADLPGQQRRLGALEPLIASKLAFNAGTIEALRTTNPAAAAARIQTGHGLELMTAIEGLIGEMKNEELALLKTRDERAAADARMTLMVILSGGAVAFAIVGCALFIIQRDLARRKRAEAALQESEARLRGILDNTDVAIYLKDLDGRFILVNRRVAELLHRDRTEIIGKTTGELLGTNAGAAFQAHDREALESHSPLSFEETAPLVDGIHTFISIKCALRDTAGVPYALCGASTDITERKQAEDEVERLRGFLDSIIENIPNMVFVKDARDLRFVRFNKAGEELLGFSRDELFGKNDYDFFPREEANFFTAKDRAVLESGTLVDIPEETIHRRDGESRILHTKKVPIRDKNGIAQFLLGISEDITERRRWEEQIRLLNDDLRHRAEQLELANRELEAFSYSVSHDLRAPLRHIDGFADLLLQHAHAALDEKARRYLDTISDSARRMGALIDDLLVFSRMGRSEMQRTTVALESLVGEVRRSLDGEMAGREIEWHIAPLPEVQGDPAMLRLVFTNLMSNAIKYTRTRARARIEVGATESGDETTVFIRDNGVGFDMEYGHKLFGVFQRLHGADEFEGTGIGLANVRRIINRHGGRTWAEGEIDRGATFCFSLPRKHEALEMKEAA